MWYLFISHQTSKTSSQLLRHSIAVDFCRAICWLFCESPSEVEEVIQKIKLSANGEPEDEDTATNKLLTFARVLFFRTAGIIL